LETRRLLIAAVLSLAILFGWQALFPPPKPAPPAPPPSAAAAPAAEPAAPSAPPTSAPEANPTAPAAAPTAAPPAPPISATSEKRVVLENETARVELSNRGAQLVSYVLKRERAEQGGALDLVQRRGDSPYPFALVGPDGGALPYDAALFAVERADGAATFEYRDATGGAKKSFHLLPDGRLDFDIALSGEARDARILFGPGIRARTVSELAYRFNHRSAVWRTAAGEVDLADARSPKQERRLPGSDLQWVGVEDTYFLAVVIPEKGLAEALLQPVVLKPAPGDTRSFDAVPLAASGEVSEAEKKDPKDIRVLLATSRGELAGTTFWGAKQYDRLAALPWGLEKTVRWGMLGVLARPLLWVLQWIHAHIVSNYGWSIVLLTIALRLLLFPLSAASFKSMRKMQLINPKMQAIRERYRPKLRDKQGRMNPDMQRQMNEEIMALYRQEGVNPAGGCLPMLVQLPIFFAFYELLENAVELYHAPWILWVHDLAAPDPHYLLPLLMGATQFLQQKMSPPPPDPMQRRLMQLLPVVFTVFSFGFPSGLVLYWMTNNLATIAQQKLYNRSHPNAPAPAPASGKKGRGGKPK
jgi:YidC/Oxa1 family membrane protein insertase